MRADLSQLNVGDFPSPRHALTSPVMTVATPRPSYPPPAPQLPYPSGQSGPTGPAPLYRQDPTPTAPPARNKVAIWLGAALAAVLVLAGVWYFALRNTGSPGGDGDQQAAGGQTTTTTKTSADIYGVRTVTESCPAAQVADARAQCVEKAECWSGMVVINGEINSIRKLPCDQGHAYETYAIALVPGDVADPYQDVLEAHPTVQKVCGTDVLLASRFGDALQYGADQWDSVVLPPSSDDKSTELGVYRCVASLTEAGSVQGSAFRPR
jgi:hypothetical protein